MRLQYYRNPPGVPDVKEEGAPTADTDEDGNVVIQIARRNTFAKNERVEIVLTSEAEWDTLKAAVDALYA